MQTLQAKKSVCVSRSRSAAVRRAAAAAARPAAKLQASVSVDGFFAASPLQAAVAARGTGRAGFRQVACMAKKSVGDLTEADLKDKVVFVRADLNVPLDKALTITDDTRIRAAIPTLEYLTSKGARVMLTSHLARAPPRPLLSAAGAAANPPLRSGAPQGRPGGQVPPGTGVQAPAAGAEAPSRPSRRLIARDPVP